MSELLNELRDQKDGILVRLESNEGMCVRAPLELLLIAGASGAEAAMGQLKMLVNSPAGLAIGSAVFTSIALTMTTLREREEERRLFGAEKG